MRLERYFEMGMKPTVISKPDAPMPLQGFMFGPMGMAANDQWTAIYRLAYERTIAAFKPTRYDRAMQAPAN